jgi:hypothetical protein
VTFLEARRPIELIFSVYCNMPKETSDGGDGLNIWRELLKQFEMVNLV